MLLLWLLTMALGMLFLLLDYIEAVTSEVEPTKRSRITFLYICISHHYFPLGWEPYLSAGWNPSLPDHIFLFGVGSLDGQVKTTVPSYFKQLELFFNKELNSTNNLHSTLQLNRRRCEGSISLTLPFCLQPPSSSHSGSAILLLPLPRG